MSADPILFDIDGYIATITLNRPDNRNSMTPEVMALFHEMIDKVKASTEVRCLIITGNGTSFCAGADFRRSSLPDQEQTNILEAQQRSIGIYSPFLHVLDLDVPVVGALNGHAIGGGMGLAMVCDIRVANKEARYGANFARLGLTTGMSTTWLLPRLIGMPRAAELLFTGRLITGAEAATLGLANYAEAPDAVKPKARELADEIAESAPIAVKWIKRSLFRHMDWNPRPAAEWESWVQSGTFETEDSVEGIRALLEKRGPKFQGR